MLRIFLTVSELCTPYNFCNIGQTSFDQGLCRVVFFWLVQMVLCGPNVMYHHTTMCPPPPTPPLGFGNAILIHAS
jgi:hypothetical protein